MKEFFISLVTLTIITFFFFGFISAVEDDGECPGPGPDPSWSEDHEQIEYRCEFSDKCGSKILSRKASWTCWENYELKTGENGCEFWELIDSDCSSPTYTNLTPQTCESYQICLGGTNWDTSSRNCQCAGKCLEKPTNPSPSNNEQNVKLPVTLNWNLVDGANSYRYKIEGILETSTISNSVKIDEAGQCLLKSSTTYDWGVTACCNSDGTNCKPTWSSWNFKTSLAPQPIVPLDPDREGPEKAENVLLTEKLKWCPIEDPNYYPETYPQSYKFLFYIFRNGIEECHPELKPNGGCNPHLLLPDYSIGLFYPPPEFSIEESKLFTKLTSYAWQAAACKDPFANHCTDWSQKWQFAISEFGLTAPTLSSPSNDPQGNNPQGFLVMLRWAGGVGTNSYRYSLYRVTVDGTIVETLAEDEKTSAFTLTLDYPYLSLDTFYSWKVRPCWDFESDDCEDAWSDLWTFRTTGRPPKLETMKPEGENIPIPTNFEWESVPGAKSFVFNIQGDGLDLATTTKESKFFFDYPDLKQEKNYSWQVKTCARENGEVCGKYSSSKAFKTFKLSVPSNPSPPDGGQLFTYEKTISWSSVTGARAYQYTVDYTEIVPEEKNEKCPGLVGTKIVSPKITLANSANLPLECLGKYNWSVRACLDKDCQETGDWAGPWSFNFVQPTIPARGGLVPCGRMIDDPNTPWNERDPCQFQHLFLLLKNILDFLLWRLGLIVLVLLAIATGVIYYFSMGAPTTMARVKSVLSSAGKGYLIVFLAWIIINLILAILGYQVGIFGRWWEIKL